MKLLLVTMVTLFLAVSQSGSAEHPPESRSFASFWAEFKGAVSKGNKEAVAGMTKLPLTYAGTQLSKAGFIEKYDAIFGEKAQRCFWNVKPIKDDNRDAYSVYCSPLIYLFEKVHGEYKFTDLGEHD